MIFPPVGTLLRRVGARAEDNLRLVTFGARSRLPLVTTFFLRREPKRLHLRIE